MRAIPTAFDNKTHPALFSSSPSSSIHFIFFILSTRPQNTSRLPLPAIPFALQIILQLYLSSPAPPCFLSSLHCRYTYVLSFRLIGIISED
ncbi:hypothetical protein HZ326_19031 [Fusarium oxysporum f. sp. albedinis]|nr:hypothetical protein HZ326_19031 [Fusarium oxysporum f. sp. albedinis]